MVNPSFISDEFDSAHDLKTVRTKVRKMGGKVANRAIDNSSSDLEKGDWVQLDDFDANIGQVKDVYKTGDDSWQLVVELPDGTFENADSYSVTKMKPGADSHKRQTHADVFEYQGGEWWVTGQKVQRGHTWYNMRNAAGEKNIVLDKTLRVLEGHAVQSLPFYMPDGPYYDVQGKSWFLNDLFKVGDVMYADIVNLADRLDHRVELYTFIAKHKIHPEPIHEVHYANMGRRRLPHQSGGVTDAQAGLVTGKALDDALGGLDDASVDGTLDDDDEELIGGTRVKIFPNDELDFIPRSSSDVVALLSSDFCVNHFQVNSKYSLHVIFFLRIIT